MQNHPKMAKMTAIARAHIQDPILRRWLAAAQTALWSIGGHGFLQWRLETNHKIEAGLKTDSGYQSSSRRFFENAHDRCPKESLWDELKFGEQPQCPVRQGAGRFEAHPEARLIVRYTKKNLAH